MIKSMKSKVVLALALVALSAAGIARATETAAPAAAPAPAAAADAKANPQTALQAWVERCQDVKKSETETVKYCETFQRISIKQKDSNQEQRVVEFAVGYPEGTKKKPNVVIVLPLGILVGEPAVLEVDGKKNFTADVKYCQPDGCFAVAPVSNGALEKIGKAKTMSVKVKIIGGQTLNIEMYPEGFKAAFDKIRAQ